MSLSDREKHDSLGTTTYDGIFITAVKTTGIFCRPSCKARKPNFENVVFYDTIQEALQYGYRPCKRCLPLNQIDQIPDYIEAVLKELSDQAFLRIKDYDLKQRNINPATIRRWFQKNYNISFHTYQRMLRINIAYQQLIKGFKIADVAYGNGFESVSGFSDSFRSIFGIPPSEASKKSIINILRISTAIGPMFACATVNGICMLEYTDRRMLEREFKDLRKRLNAIILPGKNKHLEQLDIELKEYFLGARKNFDVKIDAPGTAFQTKVWKQLQIIPYGTTSSYKNLAIALNCPKSVRAVANSNGHNRISIIIPCHRIIGSDGNLTGYGGGLHRKKWLLDFEFSNIGDPIQSSLIF